MVFIRSPKRLESPAVSSKTRQRGRKRVLLTKKRDRVPQGLILASVSQRTGPLSSGPTPLLHPPAMRLMGKTIRATQQSLQGAPVHRHPGSWLAVSPLAVRRGCLLVLRKTPVTCSHLGTRCSIEPNGVGMSIKVQFRPAQPSAPGDWGGESPALPAGGWRGGTSQNIMVIL